MDSMINNYGIKFNGVKSSEFGLKILDDKEIGFPDKVKIIQALPYSNNTIDLSAIYGEETYSERTLKFTLLIDQHENPTKDNMYQMWTKAVDWLMNTNGKVPLIDDVMSDYYYLAEVQKAPDFEEFWHHGKLTVEFSCYPYRIRSLEEGNDEWDSFNLEDGLSQYLKFKVNGMLKVNILNDSQHGTSPIVEADSELLLIFGNKSVTINKGKQTYNDVFFDRGISKLKIVGIGNISFHWHKEVI